ncbi:MAG TPA: outer membrane beta-barrel protein [Vicinamibacterales bacterium]|jgi:opacity protein-like surface antigen
MSVRKWLLSAAVVTAASLAMPGIASADWFITPFVGWNAGGSADVNGSDGSTRASEFEHKADYGVSIAGMGKGIIGAEFDFGYSPNFFSTTTDANGFAFSSGNNVATLTGNLIVGAPVGGHGAQIRPYAVGGLGLIRSNVGATGFFDATTANDFGFDVGAGLAGFFTQNIGLRGDVRYFRSFNGSNNGVGLSNFHFWRTSIGVSFKF